MTEIEAIIAELTAGQRATLLRLKPGVSVGYAEIHGKIRIPMFGKRLLEYDPDGPGSYCCKLTPTGIEVREALSA